jgi:hypothetical protein
MRNARFLIGLSVLAMLVFPAVAAAGHTTDPRTPNLVPLGHIVEPRLAFASPLGVPPQDPDIHTDIGFWGDLAIQGNWDGFNIRNISNPASPTQVSRTFCDGDQGDVIVYRNIVVRGWNSPAPATPARLCDGQPVASGFEGMHVFTIDNLADPALVQSVPLVNGSHTLTAVPDPANNRLLVYNGPSGGTTTEIVAIPFAAPQNAAVVRQFSTGGPCHDISVILGRAMLMACSGGNGVRVFSIGGPRGGSLTNPDLMYAIRVPCPGAAPVGCGGTGTVTIGHSTAFSWNGEIMIFGHEPGGGTNAECEATDSPEKKTFFFYRAADGVELGRWTLPRPQSAQENCTLHNYSVVPFLDRHVMTHGSYQAGTGVIDFTNPAAPREIAYSDPTTPEPTPTAPNPAFCSGQCALGGAWGTYWYNDVLYETHISEGLNLWSVNEPWWGTALQVDHLNPQTQEETMECEVSGRGALRAGQRGSVVLNVRVWDQAVAGLQVRLRGAGVNKTIRTNASGTARTTVRPSRAGSLTATVLRTLNMDGCSAVGRVLKARRAPSGGGVGGAGGGGVGGGVPLTGRFS